jgi:lipopolysaccharide/colanic/teichoic acid biosynthesis glycosyltransferase
MILTAILIKLDSKGPVLYSQERVGENRKPYKVHKFRSMVQDAEKETGPVWCQDDDCRVTRVGKYIRKLRIDEFPQLFNVIRGEMSFVGPRPERAFFVKELEEAIPYYGERFSVKPGITGWAQVCYSYGASVEDAKEKLNYDLFYIKNMSILLDLTVILKTVKTVIFGEGAR